MLPINVYPYLNVNDLNLDYLLKAIADMRYEVENFVSINAVKYANPIQWNITTQYEKNTIVVDPVTGSAYISVAPVPAGVALNRTDYWTLIFDLSSFVTKAAKNFTDRYEPDTTLTATFNSVVGDWIIWGDVLYRALLPINIGDAYVVGSNLERLTMGEIYIELLDDIYKTVTNFTNRYEVKNTTNATFNSVAGDWLLIGDVLYRALTPITTGDTYTVGGNIEQITMGNIYVDVLQNINDVESTLTTKIIDTALNFTNRREADGTTTATFNSVVGDWLLIGDILYRALTPITTGDTYTVGGNIEQITMGNIYVDILTTIGALSNLSTTDKSSIVNAINEIVSNVGNLNNLDAKNATNIVDAINETNKDDCIIVSASYGFTPDWTNNCVNILANMLSHKRFNNIYKAVSGGAHFSDGSYLTAIQSIENSVVSPALVKYIIVIGISNDANSSITDVIAGIQNFETYCNTQYPNAIIAIPPVSTRRNKADIDALDTLYNGLIGYQYEYNSVLSPNIYHVMAIEYDDFIASDGIHPTLAGAQVIAQAIYDELFGGGFDLRVRKLVGDITRGVTTDKTFANISYTVAKSLKEVHLIFAAKFTMTNTVNVGRNLSMPYPILKTPELRPADNDSIKYGATIMGTIYDITDDKLYSVRICNYYDSNVSEYCTGICAGSTDSLTLTSGHTYRLDGVGGINFRCC